MAASRKFFVNLPVRDLPKSKAFFQALGFDFNPKFTNGEKSACFSINEETSVMFLAEPSFQTFMHREICNTATHVEGLFTISCGSRAEVDELVNRALAAGGRTEDRPQDQGFMYDWSFLDPDGHHWGVMWMDPAAMQ